MRHFLLLAALAFSAVAHSAETLPLQQSHADYIKAIKDVSTSPYYVQVLLAFGPDQTARPYCVRAPFLQGALAREVGQEINRETWKTVQKLALENTERVFLFTKAEAISNLALDRYTPDDLDRARALLAPYSAAELKEAFTTRTLREARRFNTAGYQRDAIACALLERGLTPRSADITGAIGFYPD
ncbi:hypothetical protein ACFPZM_17245 [Pseudoduganella danionis]